MKIRVLDYEEFMERERDREKKEWDNSEHLEDGLTFRKPLEDRKHAKPCKD